MIALPTSIQDGCVVNNQLSVGFELLEGFVLSFRQVLGRRSGREKKSGLDLMDSERCSQSEQVGKGKSPKKKVQLFQLRLDFRPEPENSLHSGPDPKCPRPI